MSKRKVGSTYYLVLGLVLFPLGLFMLFGISPIKEAINALMPATETVQIFGLILQFLGEGLICFGIVGAISGKVAATTDNSRQILVANALRSSQEQNVMIAGFKKSVDDQIGQLHAKLNNIQAQVQAQKVAAPAYQALSKCRYCGTKITQGPFCPSCGKAN
jgi:hypothetical protein